MQPTQEQWKNLYEAANAFKVAAPWNVFEDSDIFAVKDPYTGKTGYCCIMGAGGQLFGLALYLGKRGLDTIHAMLEGELHDDPLFVQHCLMLSFDDREDLHPEEYKQIKSLGLKYRGRSAWPAFKIHEPGYYPWILEKAEDVLFLTAALEQVIQVALSAPEDAYSYIQPQGEKLLTRIATAQEDGSLQWNSEWLVPEEDKKEPDIETPFVLNELQLAKLKKTVKKTSSSWEVSCFFMPTPVDDKGRPYYPMIFAVIDQDSNQIISMNLFEQQEAPFIVPEKMVELLETVKLLPAKLVTNDAKVFDLLSEVIESFDLKCFTYNGPLMMDDFKDSLFNRMGR
ncbi:DUF7309 domain-containing protein [Paenibacillus luteus]|uniref:DUF7309 domain-containing protein n=1 Tax=Paenibacillus luteus TaxID=2545753 RepID=UPI00114275A6|nr:hypothetical protein [Paenibacillus luteus]